MDDSYTLITTTEIDAPVGRVWDAWNDPVKIAQWWGPAGFHSTVRELDVREGGRFDVIMHGPDGTDYPNLYVFDRVERHRQLVYTNAGSTQFGLNGASLKDPTGLFNASREGNARRAVDLHEGNEMDEEAFRTLIRAAAALNRSSRA